MDLVGRYLQAVKLLLPGAEQADILRELSENIVSQMQDRERDLGRPLNESEQAAILKQHGHPLLAATQYRRTPVQQLIGPMIFPFYWFALRTLLYIALAVGALNSIALLASGDGARQILAGLLAFAHVALPVFGWVTFLFAVLDFVQGKFRLLEKLDRQWDPLSLRAVKEPRQVRRSESVFGLIFGAVYLGWLLAAPYYPYLVLGPAASVLRLSRAWHRFYLPVLILAVAGLAQAGVNLARPDLTWLRAVLRFGSNAAGLAILYGLLKTFPFVEIVAQPGRNAARYETLAAIVNVTVVLTLACFEVALFVAVVWHAFQCLKEIGRRIGSRRESVGPQSS